MLTVNLFAGPGAGKSTMAAAVFAALKERGISAELVTEFAKDCAWEGRTGPLRCQPYVWGEQLWRLERLRGRGVEVAVTDSPSVLSAVYGEDGGARTAFISAVLDQHAADRRGALNVFVQRVKAYDPRGRFQGLSEARALDERIFGMFQPFDLVVNGVPAAVNAVVETVVQRLGGGAACCHKTRLAGAPCPVGRACPHDKEKA